MERPRGIKALVKGFREIFVQSPVHELYIQQAMRIHEVYNSHDLPLSVRSGLATKMLMYHEFGEDMRYDGSDNLALWYALTSNLGVDSMIEATKLNLIDTDFLGITGKGKTHRQQMHLRENLIHKWIHQAKGEGWKQDPKSDEQIEREMILRTALINTGFGFLSEEAFGVTLLKFDSGRFELGWKDFDDRGEVVLHQSLIDDGYIGERQMTAENKIKILSDAGFPIEEIPGRIFL